MPCCSFAVEEYSVVGTAAAQQDAYRGRWSRGDVFHLIKRVHVTFVKSRSTRTVP
ncbi:hypothetical protein WH47_11359 [Habropoda laboriosa]|uniref:Uncharacterized protein n=1 Tax=Habropoda laboriosa TaxID=597456 RepID=A0A0L7QLW6_9HYME|nr:hypothetical protein WH47_11359 [Habropoda laboriosa]